MNKRKCDIEGCGSDHCANGFCRKHYMRVYKHGDAYIVLRQETKTKDELREKLLAHRRICDNGCWEWIKAKKGSAGGYGTLAHAKRNISPHRASAFVFLGLSLRSKKQSLHKCDNPPCFNPDHLFIGTQKQNAQDMEKKGRTYRPNFHGSMLPQSMLVESQVSEIKRLLGSGVEGRKIAAQFNIAESAISKIKHGKAWKHVA